MPKFPARANLSDAILVAISAREQRAQRLSSQHAAMGCGGCLPRQRAAMQRGGWGPPSRFPSGGDGNADVPPPSPAAGAAATSPGGMCHASPGQPAATVLLPFSLRGGLFWHFITRSGLFCQKIDDGGEEGLCVGSEYDIIHV